MNFVQQTAKLKFKIIFIIAILLLSTSATYAADLPALIMVYDDGYKEDLELVFPVHDKYNVPAVTAVNSDYIGGKLWLNQEELLFLQSKGWEIANHGKKHAALIMNSLTNKAEAGENKIRIENGYLLEEEYNYILFNQEKNIKEKIKIKYKDNKKNYSIIKINNELENSYPKNQTYLRLDQASVEEEIIDSRQKLEKMGLIIDSFIYPYNGYYSLPLELVSKNYKAARAGYRSGESFPEAFINKRPFKKYELKAAAIEKNLIRESDIFKLLDELKEENGLLIFYGHPHNQNFEIERIEKIIKYALNNEIEISTFRELF